MGGWRKCNSHYPPPNIVRMIKSRRLRRTGDVARKGEMRKEYGILVEKLEGKGDHLDVIDVVDGKIILKWVLKK
jgi:hypothetical protein